MRLVSGFGIARRDSVVARCLITMALFSFFCLPFVTQMPVLAHDNLGIDPELARLLPIPVLTPLLGEAYKQKHAGPEYGFMNVDGTVIRLIAQFKSFAVTVSAIALLVTLLTLAAVLFGG